MSFLFFLFIATLSAADPDNSSNEPRAFKDCSDCPELVVIEPGEFYLTSPPLWQGRPFGLGPMRKVIVKNSYAIGKFEITVGEWQHCVDANGCQMARGAETKDSRLPIANISWDDALKYTKWLSDKTNQIYRLPSEAEWEFAARAGAGRSRFFDLPEEEICNYANIYDISAHQELEYEWRNINCNDKYVRESPVGSFKANKFGLHDALGNVWEWAEDCKSSIGTRHMRNTSGPVLKGDCSLRAFRGSSWLSHPPKYIRPSDRYKFSGSKSVDLGFRVVREMNPSQ